MMRSAAAGSIALLASAQQQQQDWGTQGSWAILAPNTNGPSLAYRGPTMVAGTFVVTANNSGNGQMCAYAYDYVSNTWTQWPDIVGPAPINDPALFTIGGVVVAADETNYTNIATINSAAARSTVGYTWSFPLVSGGPAVPRFGQRYLVWGSTVYAFAGMDIATGAMHNDLWAIDSSRLAAAPSGGTGSDLPLMWAQVQGDNAPGFPPGRVGYSFSGSTGTMAALFGGVSLAPGAPAGMLADACFSPSNAAYCIFHQSVWAFLPGDKQAGAGAITGANWLHLNEGGAYGGPVPVGRFDHTAGIMGDQLFVYGGTGASGPLDEMWVYNLVSQAWGQVAPSQPRPSAINSDLGYGLGVVMGHHVYRFVQAADPVSGSPLANTGALWRWTPAASSGASTPPAAELPMHPGAVAALTIGVLLSVFNSALLVMLTRNAGALPDFLSGLCSGYRRPGGSRAGPDGFYASSSSDAPSLGADALYAPPPA